MSATPTETGTVVHAPRQDMVEWGQAGEQHPVITRSGRQAIRPCTSKTLHSDDTLVSGLLQEL